MKSNLMRISMILLLLLSASGILAAETKTFIREYSYQASELDSKVSCRTIALELVKRLLLEEAGTYLESETEVRNYQLTKDQITVLTAGVVRAELLNEKWDGKTYYIQAKLEVNPKEVEQSIQKLRQDVANQMWDIIKEDEPVALPREEIKFVSFEDAIKELAEMSKK